jgi:hypothetical protein
MMGMKMQNDFPGPVPVVMTKLSLLRLCVRMGLPAKNCKQLPIDLKYVIAKNLSQVRVIDL